MSYHLTRRSFLQGVGASSLVIPTAAAVQPALAGAQDIARENSLPGTRDWLLSNTRIDPKTRYRCPWIEGYCSHTSLRAGDTLQFFVSTNPVSEFTLDISRLGYYGGAGGRLMKRIGPLEGERQADPEVGGKRLRDCQWQASAELEIPGNWVSGVYIGKLTAEQENIQSYTIFIVRDDREADLLLSLIHI